MLLNIFYITASAKKMRLCPNLSLWFAILRYYNSAANLSLCGLPHYDTSAAFGFYKTWLHTDILLREVVRKGGGVVRSV